MPAIPRLTTALLCGSALALAGCSGVRLQSAEQFQQTVYSSLQTKARADCRQRSSPAEASACLRETGTSHDDYERSRERLQNPMTGPTSPTTPATP